MICDKKLVICYVNLYIKPYPPAEHLGNVLRSFNLKENERLFDFLCKTDICDNRCQYENYQNKDILGLACKQENDTSINICWGKSFLISGGANIHIY